MNRILCLQEKIRKYPFGIKIFPYAIARQALELHDNYISVFLRKRRSVTNHIKTVHAIAMCNLCEYAGGVCMEASIPKNRRWIPRGMKVAYLKKAMTALVGTCDLSHVDWETCDNVICHVSVKDSDGVEVMTADIDSYVSDK